MVQEAPKEHAAVLAFCTYCGTAYLASDLFGKSHCHDTEPVLTYDLEMLFDSMEVLAGLVRDRVAGAADELSQEPANASEASAPESGEADDFSASAPALPAPPSPEASLSAPPATETVAEGGPMAKAPSAAPAKRTRTRRQPAAVAS